MKDTAEDAGWSLRWTIREAAWNAEEKFLWRGTDVARTAGERALTGMEPLQRVVQTKLAWPVADAWRDGGTTVKTGLATAAVAAVAATSAGAAALAGDAGSAPPMSHAKVAPDVPALASAGVPTTLNGVSPDFAPDEGKGKTVAAPVVDPAQAVAAAKPKPIVAPEPGASPDKVAKAFAEAFVRYEVGQTDASTTEVFRAVAEKPLAQTLEQDPPRLPAGTDVPEAEVLNVVLAEPDGKQIEASVSLSRMEAASELRITLQSYPDGWQVVEVRG
jgi:hypothetical protein